jgi:CheY-like chemotaxis protein
MSQGPAILVVDDSSTMRNLIAFHLSKQGFRVTGVAGSRDALEYCRESLPDVVIMDLELDGESGLDLMRRFQQDPVLIQVPIIACSGNTDPSLRQLVLNSGARKYLVKDHSMRNEIVDAIQNVLAVPCSSR